MSSFIFLFDIFFLLNEEISFSDFQSSSPPKKDATTIYTPSSGQKRFNPFMKDNSGSTAMGKNDDDESIYSRTNTSPTHKLTPLTPTKSHPLMDLQHTTKPSRGEFMDTTSSSSSSEESDKESGEMKDDAVVDCGDDEHENKTQDDELNLPNNNIVENSSISSSHTQLPAEADTMTIQQHALDEKNNNTQLNESDDEAEKQQQRLTVDKVMRRKKSPSRVNNNNNNNIRNNNNRMSYPVTRDRSQPADVMTTSATVMTASVDRIDGKTGAHKNPINEVIFNTFFFFIN